MADPNFPPNLDIYPLDIIGGQSLDPSQSDAIAKYGIAGRVWEAGRALLDYFTPGRHFDPPCTIFQSSSPHRILELGSGQSVASLYLASHLSPSDLLILTDLPNVIPLCQQSIGKWRPDHEKCAQVIARPLAWGEHCPDVHMHRPFTHILLCDLVYFPHLYPSLLVTLLEFTEPDSAVIPSNDVFGPEVIIAYHSRSLALEESFFDALSLYFQLLPVVRSDWEARVFICRRWRVTKEWSLPGAKDVMKGHKAVVRGRSHGLIDGLFGSIEM